MTNLPINEVQSVESPPNSTSKGADNVPFTEHVNSGDFVSVNEENPLNEDIQTQSEENGQDGDIATQNEDNEVELIQEAKDKNDVASLVASEDKSEPEIMGTNEETSYTDTRLLEEDLQLGLEIAIEETDIKVRNEDNSSIDLVVGEEKSKTQVTPSIEEPDKKDNDGKSNVELRDMILDNRGQELEVLIEEKLTEVKNQETFPSNEKKHEILLNYKVDEAKQPAAVMITSRRSRKKPRGKPPSNRSGVALSYRKSRRSRSTSVATPKVDTRNVTRRKSTGSYSIGRQKISNCNHINEHKLYLQSHSAQYRRRIKNVKSRLFKETKSFVAYKSARHKEAQERRNKVEEIARKTQRLYADRSIDFSKKSKRQREDIWRRRSTIKI